MKGEKEEKRSSLELIENVDDPNRVGKFLPKKGLEGKNKLLQRKRDNKGQLTKYYIQETLEGYKRFYTNSHKNKRIVEGKTVFNLDTIGEVKVLPQILNNTMLIELKKVLTKNERLGNYEEISVDELNNIFNPVLQCDIPCYKSENSLYKLHPKNEVNNLPFGEGNLLNDIITKMNTDRCYPIFNVTIINKLFELLKKDESVVIPKSRNLLRNVDFVVALKNRLNEIIQHKRSSLEKKIRQDPKNKNLNEEGIKNKLGLEYDKVNYRFFFTYDDIVERENKDTIELIDYVYFKGTKKRERNRLIYTEPFLEVCEKRLLNMKLFKHYYPFLFTDDETRTFGFQPMIKYSKKEDIYTNIKNLTFRGQKSFNFNEEQIDCILDYFAMIHRVLDGYVIIYKGLSLKGGRKGKVPDIRKRLGENDMTTQQTRENIKNIVETLRASRGNRTLPKLQ